ncbi:hypothetical protein NGB36_00430 [Streptomyces sp. RB6PN25]|uniref:propane 2-monooxygenase n=1 Tax=Streptomyces humicola TaxID=2953240 RepID=A0ABT1PN75_9ACTN|nr:hypothetical protein [Streptomyces humicola]MCQ4079119.1 hypothetical protein [Streptomyces humicola]
MPGLARSECYDLTRDMNGKVSYVDEDQAWPEDLSNSFGVPAEAWWRWDEPHKITYCEYVHNQVGFSVNNVTRDDFVGAVEERCRDTFDSCGL